MSNDSKVTHLCQFSVQPSKECMNLSLPFRSLYSIVGAHRRLCNTLMKFEHQSLRRFAMNKPLPCCCGVYVRFCFSNNDGFSLSFTRCFKVLRSFFKIGSLFGAWENDCAPPDPGISLPKFPTLSLLAGLVELLVKLVELAFTLRPSCACRKCTRPLLLLELLGLLFLPLLPSLPPAPLPLLLPLLWIHTTTPTEPRDAHNTHTCATPTHTRHSRHTNATHPMCTLQPHNARHATPHTRTQCFLHAPHVLRSRSCASCSRRHALQFSVKTCRR